MTFYTLRIFSIPSPAISSAELESPDWTAPVFSKLQDHARAVGPYRLQDWAKARGLTVHFVDNCWIRVVTNGLDLLSFFDEALAGQTVAASAVTPDSTFVIEAEEY